MKIFYRKSIVDKVREAIADAARLNKKIESIELAPEEWAELCRWFDSFNFTGVKIHYGNVVTFDGVRVRKAPQKVAVAFDSAAILRDVSCIDELLNKALTHIGRVTFSADLANLRVVPSGTAYGFKPGQLDFTR